MPLIQSFRALRPAPDRAQEILAPPYDVLDSEEARRMAEGRPWSFLHVSKPEIDLPANADPYGEQAYAKAAENFQRMIADGILIRDNEAGYYVYRLTRRGRAQTGIAAVASVAEYRTNRIRKHELTTPVKEDDRVRQIEAIKAQTGPVMMAYPDAPEVDAILAAATETAATVDVTTNDGVRHQLWTVTASTTIDSLTAAFDALPALYIADGHHRSAAADRIAQSAGSVDSAQYFLSVLFPAHEMTILDYNRVLRDLNGHPPADILNSLQKPFSVVETAGAERPKSASEFSMYLDGKWYALRLRADLVPEPDPIGRLPITMLSRHVIEPIFGIDSPRTDKRIDFVGGARGLEELSWRVDSGEMAAAFVLYPTQMSDLIAVADAGEIMPPKSTWFEPKLADGMVSHVLD